MTGYYKLLVCFFPLYLYGQNGAEITVDSCRNAFIEQINIFPQEKIFVHTDRTAYVAGDIIWLKIYLVDAITLLPSAYSRFAYVDLIDFEGSIVNRIKIRINKNESCGQIAVSQDLPEGNYSLRAYTTAMYGLSHDFFFKKNLFIASQTKTKNKPRYFADNKTDGYDEMSELLSAEWKNDTLRVSRNSADMQPQFLLIHSRGVPYYFKKWYKDAKALLFPKQNFPSGILQVTLLDENYSPLSQKMLLCFNDDQAHLKCTFEKKNNLRKIRFELTDNEGKSIAGNFSVSITDDDLTKIDTTENIGNYLLFNSDLKEKTTKFDCDFVSNEIWKRYDMPQVIKGITDTLPSFVELGQTISGKVKNLWGKKVVPDAQINIMSLQTMFAKGTISDKNGNFTFNEMDFPDKTEFVVQAYNDKGKSSVLLFVDESDFPAVDSIDFPVQIDSAIIEQTKQYGNIYDNIKTVQLAEVLVESKKTEKPSHSYSAMADVSFDSKKINELNATCVHELLRRIAGVQVIGDNVVIRGASSIYGTSFAAIAVDGVIWDTMNDDGTSTSEFDLDVINLSDVERVDVFKGGSSVIWGARGGNGVIAFTTKKGNFDYSKIEQVRYNTKKIYPLGYLIPEKFSRQDYNPLIYWNPNVNTDETGKISIEFPISDKKGQYSLIVQGITDDGLIIRHIEKIVL
jgi:hypothetical protein